MIPSYSVLSVSYRTNNYKRNLKQKGKETGPSNTIIAGFIDRRFTERTIFATVFYRVVVYTVFKSLTDFSRYFAVFSTGKLIH